MSDHPENIKRLGEIVNSARNERGLTVRALGQQIGIHHSSITRLERGEFSRPTPDFLKRIARALGLELSDLYHLAGHTLPEDLPDFEVYLRTRHRQLPEHAISQLSEYFSLLRDKYGNDRDGPAPGEDETDEPLAA